MAATTDQLLRRMESMTAEERMAIARRKDLTPALFERLASDESWFVRWIVAEHVDLPRELVTRLAVDPDRDVRRAVARRPALAGGDGETAEAGPAPGM
jgi:hypothetical protein